MAQMSFRINEQTKKEFEELCDQLGMTPTTALTIFIKKMCREQSIPFEVSLYNHETKTAMNESKNYQSVSRTFEDPTELLNELNDED